MITEITAKLAAIKQQLPKDVTLVAVSKTYPAEVIQEAYDAGQRVFGENKIQEMAAKFEVLPKDIQWHMIGHVQTNKVKFIAPFVSLIHSVDSLKLLAEIDRQALKAGRIIDCLLQIHIAREEHKFGFDRHELEEIILNNTLKQYPNVKVKGLMGMATYTDNDHIIKEEFSILKDIFAQYSPAQDWTVLSMGMSGDYHIAVSCGSNMIRLGSSIFGNRKS
jgi:PLP dependent protein